MSALVAYVDLIGNAMEHNLQMFVIMVCVHAAQDTFKLIGSASCTRVKIFKFMMIRILIRKQGKVEECVLLSYRFSQCDLIIVSVTTDLS